MKKILILAILIAHFSSPFAQNTVLSGELNPRTSEVDLEWNMVRHSSRTGYTLLKSRDGVNWTEVLRDRILRNYTEEDVYTYGDKAFPSGQNYYRIKITDATNNIVALSNIISLNTNSRNKEVSKNAWIIYPNPVRDVLNISYNGNKRLEGCYNLTIQDMSGKIVVRYRCASIYKSFQVPVGKLQRGSYLVEVVVNNETVVSERFVKQ